MTGEVIDSWSDGVGVDGALYRQLQNAMSSARRRLWIVVPWWDTSPAATALFNEVKAAKRRNVDVRVIIRPEQSNAAMLARLRNADIDVITIRNIHAKSVLFDHGAVPHSTNFTRKELAENQNVGQVHYDAATVTAYAVSFEQLVADRDALSVGQEQWTPAQDVLGPAGLMKYLDRYNRLNPLQSKAVPAVLSATGHIMVVAPTSSGKTLVGEVAALRSIIMERRPAVWLLPARALAAEVAQTVRRWRALGINALELTGEVNVTSDTARRAQLWVATTEKFESMYRRSTLRDYFDNVGCLIIDEVHLVGDSSRGAVLESVIARLRSMEARTRIVALSATVANAHELAEWFGATLIQSAWRPTVLTVQLVPYDPGRGQSEWAQDEAGKSAALKRLLTDLAAPAADKPATLREAVGPDSQLGSVLVFCGSKPGVRQTAAMLAEIPAVQGDDDGLVRQARNHGVGTHFRDAPHAVDALRAFNGRELNALVATSGLSTGVNTPARIVVIRDLKLGQSPLEVSQAQQMLGRAGRAGQEREGYGFVLVPRHLEAEWRGKLATGYRVDSQLTAQIDDIILAEILLGSITSRADAEIWFKGTFAYAQSSELHDVGAVIDDLVKYRLATEHDGALSATELGKLTARLMIGVPAASAMLHGLDTLGYPTDATDAENQVLGLVARSVPVLQELPVNSRTYEPWVAGLLTWHGLDRLAGESFGSRFAAAAAAAALRQPSALSAPRGSKMSRSEMLRAVDEIPRFLNWLGALGALGESSWPPAVAGDLARRLQWWNLDPAPTRGSGRLLSFLEQLVDPEHRDRRLPGLWNRARGKGFDDLNRINRPPLRIDASPESFVDIVNRRVHLVVSPGEGSSVEPDAGPYGAQMTIITNSGALPAHLTTQALGQPIQLPVPHDHDKDELAADVLLYGRTDFAYQSTVVKAPNLRTRHSDDALRQAQSLINRLTPSAAVAPRAPRLRRLVMRERKRTLAELMPQVSPEPGLAAIAETLTGREFDPGARVLRLRSGIEALLEDAAPGDHLRSAAEVLKSGTASPREFECVLLALASSVGLETGMAMSANNHLIALVEIGGRWHTATPVDKHTGHIDRPLSPATLPAILTPIAVPSSPGPVRPLIPWLIEFAPGSGERPQAVQRPPSTPVTDEEFIVTHRDESIVEAGVQAFVSDQSPPGVAPAELDEDDDDVEPWEEEEHCEDCGSPDTDWIHCEDCDERVCDACEHWCPHGEPRYCPNCDREYWLTPTCGCD